MTDSESDDNPPPTQPFERHVDEGVGFDLVGSVGNNQREDKEMEDFKNMLKKRKKKKKKKKKKTPSQSQTPSENTDNTNEDTNNFNTGEINYFNSEDKRDYPYTLLLDRIFRQLREKNPNLVSSKDGRLALPPLSVSFVGGKKTGWGNFGLICERIRRDPEHVKHFFLTEMNTTGNKLKNGGLIFKGRWRNKQIESLLNKYRKLYITCENCRSSKTQLHKDSNTRLYFLKCDVCNSSRSVTNIRGGFKAATREDRRAKKFGR